MAREKEKKEEKEEKKDWFRELYSDVPSDFPPDLQIKDTKIHRVTFEEKAPRVVMGGYNKPTAVINVLYKGEHRSLYVGSNVDIARHIWNLWKTKNKSLKGCTVDIARLYKKGRNWIYEVKEVH